ncbi:MAG: LLM class F420-dependent oxidoreductase [Chloroflexi bacterium RBG_13_66_10]|nr:MAG: LLM class F420-dependent oxidoreductase [Chloroflexi bacterium RBG_13_66_10]
MLFDASLPPASLAQVPQIADAAERIGFDALWAAETQHDPFLPLALAAEHTERLHLGTAIAVGFARSPATLAYTAWDLADYSRGRFILGLGTQVRAHIRRRFGMPWPDSPAGKLRELVGAIRAFWRCWQTGEPLSFRGGHFRLSLMTPFFNPGPIDHPEIPIYLAGVNTALCRLAGEIADGLHAHPYHSESYLREVVEPAVTAGAAHAGRSRADVRISVTAFAVTSADEAGLVRAQIAFYASTPTYRPVMAFHGWGDTADRLRELARSGAWAEMPSLITEEMLGTFAVTAPPDELGAALHARYRGLADRLSLYLPFSPGERDGFWSRLTADLHQA